MSPTPPPRSRLRPGGLGEMRGYARRSPTKDGYTTPAGKLPSCTGIIGATSDGKEHLQRWLKRPNAEAISLDARSRGTWTHTRIESWISGTPPRGFAVPLADLLWGEFYRNVEPWLATHFLEALAIEQAVWHPAGYSGTFDCVGYAAYGSDPTGRALTLLDWKTAQRERTGGLLDDYRCQLAAYRHAIQYCFGVKPERALLVIARPHSAGPDVHELLAPELDHWEAEFFRRLHLYYAA